MRVAGLGQAAAGDDGVGLVVLERLRQAPPEGVQLVALRDAVPLIELLDGEPLLLIDALVSDEAPGTLRWLTAAEVGRAPLWSTHGMGLPDALGMAQVLHGDDAGAELAVLAVCIAPPQGVSMGLSPAVAEAVPRAVDEVHHYLARRGPPPGSTHA